MVFMVIIVIWWFDSYYGYFDDLMVILMVWFWWFDFDVWLFWGLSLMFVCQPQAPLQSPDLLPDSSQTAPWWLP